MNQKILLIEDNPVSRKVVRVALEADGYRVVEAPDGKTGIAMMVEENPDLVLQDLLLPDFNGFDLVSELRALRKDEKVPILALTGLIEKTDAMRIANAPFTDYLFKPVAPSHLVSVVRSHLASAQIGQERRGKNRRILLVDDEPAQLKLFAIYLSHLGFQVTTATDGNDGFAKAQRDRPEAIEALFESLEASPLAKMPDAATLRAAHEERVAHQLNRQAKLGAQLAQRCAAQSAQLSVLASMGENFLRGKNDDETLLKDILARCLDAIGFSCGAIFLADSENRLSLAAELGFSVEARQSLPTFFGCEDLLRTAMLQIEPVTLSFSVGGAERFVQSFTDLPADNLLICPLWSGSEQLGIVALVSNKSAPDADKTTFAKAITTEIAQVIALNRSISKLKYIASYDSLTGLPNRAQLCERIRSAGTERRAAALFLLNLDHFQEINNTVGYPGGNLLLREVAQRLKENFQERALVARLGSDEFAVLMIDAADDRAVRQTAKEIVKCLEPTFRLDGLPVAIRTTMGVAIRHEHGEDPETLLSHADMAQRAAKRTGDDYLAYPEHVESYSPDLLAMLGELREAVDQNALALYYQPKVNFETRQTVGVEALLRWPHPRRGWVPPDRFISLAERAGLI